MVVGLLRFCTLAAAVAVGMISAGDCLAEGREAVQVVFQSDASTVPAVAINGTLIKNYIYIGTEHISKIEETNTIYKGSKGRGIIVGYMDMPGVIQLGLTDAAAGCIESIVATVYQYTKTVNGTVQTYDVDLAVNDSPAQTIPECASKPATLTFPLDAAATTRSLRFASTGGGVYIHSFIINYADGSAAIIDLQTDQAAQEPTRYFNLSGQPLPADALPAGPVIEVKGSRATKSFRK